MNFKEWHDFMKNNQYQSFQREFEHNKPSANKLKSDLTRRYQEKYIEEHPLSNKIYNGITNFFNDLERFRKEIFY